MNLKKIILKIIIFILLLLPIMAMKKNLVALILDQLKFQKKKIKYLEKMKLKKQKTILIH